ncbi:PD-(D/E)XK nuclease family protein [Flagellimonas zhangzhouensis]|uniref:PD-(D/E)XK nuclease superfamily protein n=1 Tax=Flagellimonas zhangzhouensis TaxID=1073328 RepID=A0A1H2V1N4_9FLAO|nr:PD-(D/E)XK nuclease family protein [Allomuricauda zhangzhouensis]SDQ12006.1 PD-(D/E)XK nuclease superfamily protein [Allomuricauda zhangzhouensis]SDW61814.1 PD-(D/E)XK nuclease superfamily protein [Allomuricauda zhangzhouensis]
MHKTFLEYVVDDLSNQNVDSTKCTFVLPSKRSGTFLKKIIAKHAGKTIFSSSTQSIQEFITEISGLAPAANIDLLLLLFEVYKKSPIAQHDDFGSFMKWGQTLLSDFNDIDGYLIPANEILNYLSAIKEINHWSLKKDKTELIENYLQLWGNLETIYNEFYGQLISRQLGYQGLIQREAVKKLEQKEYVEINNPLVFVGFNALNAAESKIIQHFLGEGNAHVYWDIDSYFLDDPIHDAGLFIRNYKRTWPYYHHGKILNSQNNFLQPKSITITGVPKNISQTKYVGQLLEELAEENQNQAANTALVLADESLLNPMLNAIPQQIQEVNITMGMPLNQTVLYSFFLNYLDLTINKTDRGWFHKHVLEFISNPYTIILSEIATNNFTSRLAKDIKEENWLYIEENVLSKFTDNQGILGNIFPSNKVTALGWIDNCLTFIDHLKTHFQNQQNALELEFLYRFYLIFNQLQLFLAKVDFMEDLKSVKSLYKQLAGMENLDFIGEPLTGFQIMGMLESRNLDFETVIITSVNEGILPSGKSNNSFIPFDVKRDFGLPTYKEKDAIYVYHFYRLLQRAKNIYLIYNTEPDVLEGGERSRLISQLLTDENLKPYIKHTIAAPEVSIESQPLFQVEKTDLLLEDIKLFAASGFSPTSLTNYIKNPIDFYTRNILKINDLDEVEENIAANTFGTIIHDSLEQLYTPLINQVLTEDQLKGLQKQVPEVVQHHFQLNLSGVDFTKGKFLLVYNVIKKYLNNFLEDEIKQVKQHEIRILALEQRYEEFISVPGLDFPIKLKGTLDRVDQFDGTVRIIDYKTGKVEAKNVKITDWEALTTDYDKSKAFQLLCYAYLYSKKHGKSDLQAGIISFKNLSQGLFPFSEDKNTRINSDTLATFENLLFQLIGEICNTAIPLTEKVN